MPHGYWYVPGRLEKCEMDPRSGTGPVRCRLISHTAARRTIVRPLGPHQSGSSGQTFRCDSCWSGWLCPPAESQTEVTALSKPSRHWCRQNALAALLATSAIGVAPQKIILARSHQSLSCTSQFTTRLLKYRRTTNRRSRPDPRQRAPGPSRRPPHCDW